MVIPRILSYDEAGSTNQIARELIAKGCCSGTLVRAGKQSRGRGQADKAFSSPPGGLYFSLILQPEVQPDFLPLVTLATGLAVRDVIQAETGIAAMIKWPNDVYLVDRKVAGILCESVPDVRHSPPSPAWVIIGVGLNVNTALDDFPVELRTILTTLRACSGQMYNLDSLLQALVCAIKIRVRLLHCARTQVLAQWQAYDYLFDKKVVYSSGSVTLAGTGQGIGPQGTYRLRDAQGIVHTILGGQLRPHRADEDPLPPCTSPCDQAAKQC